MKNAITTRRASIILIIVLTTLFHGWNMLKYPYFENDEGTYMSQAWSLTTKGELAPYTYWYDHAPAGWIFIAIWTMLTGGFFTFGLSVESGRVFMLLIQVLNALLVAEITYRSTRKRLIPSIIAAIVFATSPMGIYFHRRVLLDNLMTFWVLLSWWLLLKDHLSLRRIVVSGIALGIATLTKENAIFFIFPLAILVWVKSHAEQKRFALLLWGCITIAVISLYPLFAIIKTELLPDPAGNKVSLIGSLKLQLSRGQSKPFWQAGSDFMINYADWNGKDPFILWAGWISIATVLFLGIFNRLALIAGLMGTSFWIFMLRGGLIIDFYIVPHIAFAAINIGILFQGAHKITKSITGKTIIVLVIIGLVIANTNRGWQVFTHDETGPQKQALAYIYQNYSKDTNIAVDSFAFVDLRESGYYNAEWFWKIWADPNIKNKYNNDWRNISAMMVGHEFLRQMGLQPRDSLIRPAFEYSDVTVQYGPNDPSTYIDKNIFLTTNGDWMAIYQLPNKNILAGKQAWTHFKQTFIHSYGQVIDPQSNSTTSEGQSYAMLMSVWENDKTTFDGVWAWTKDHLQHRQHDKLLSWKWGIGSDGNQGLLDAAPASDADQDIALALIFAYRQWGDPQYLADAKKIIKDIWINEVVNVNNRYILTAGAKPMYQDYYIVNPSYLSPASYKIFAQVDDFYPWEELANDSYKFLEDLSRRSNKRLPSNWILINKNDYSFASASPVYGPVADEFGYDAFRIMWRIAQDAKWHKSQEAYKYLESQSGYFSQQWQMRQKFFAVINSVSGEEKVDYSKLSTSGAGLSVLAIVEPQIANEIYQTVYLNRFDHNTGYWDDGLNYYDQSWAWFATQQYLDQTPNLWSSNK